MDVNVKYDRLKIIKLKQMYGCIKRVITKYMYFNTVQIYFSLHVQKIVSKNLKQWNYKISKVSTSVYITEVLNIICKKKIFLSKQWMTIKLPPQVNLVSFEAQTLTRCSGFIAIKLNDIRSRYYFSIYITFLKLKAEL